MFRVSLRPNETILWLLLRFCCTNLFVVVVIFLIWHFIAAYGLFVHFFSSVFLPWYLNSRYSIILLASRLAVHCKFARISCGYLLYGRHIGVMSDVYTFGKR